MVIFIGSIELGSMPCSDEEASEAYNRLDSTSEDESLDDTSSDSESDEMPIIRPAQHGSHEWFAEKASSRWEKYKITHRLEDLDAAIAYLRKADSMRQLLSAAYRSLLGLLLWSRFKHLGNHEDLSDAIEHQHTSLMFTSRRNPNMPVRLNGLGNSLLSLFQHLGQVKALDQAIIYQQRALAIAPGGYPNLPLWLSNLAYSLDSRFVHLGDLTDLDQAIEHHHRALSLTPAGDLVMATRLNSLGESLHSRFQRLGNLTDLDKAIEHQQRAVELDLARHANLAIWRSNLGYSLHSRFEHQGNLVDLKQAIEHQQSAIALTPNGHRYMPTRLHYLGTSFLSLFDRLSDVADLNKAIECQQRAVSLAPQGNHSLPAWLSNLASLFRSRFERLGELSLTDDVSRCYNYTLQTPFVMRTGDNFDFNQSLVYDRKAALSLTGSPRLRFQVATQWANTCDEDRNGASLDAYRQAMTLLPQLVWIGISVESRYKDIVGVGNVSARAVSAAIVKRKYHLALEWWEEGRSIVWRQMMQLRAPVDDIAAINPALATELQRVARDLEHTGSHTGMAHAIQPSNEHSFEHIARRHRRLAEKWEQLIIHIRRIPGLGDFLRPRVASELICSAHASAVVMLNLHKDRCDALIIRPLGLNVSYLTLAQFSYQKATNISNQMSDLVRSRGLINRGVKTANRAAGASFESMLAELWNDVVKPVLSFLGYNHKGSGECMPRVTWCTTGPLSFLPIHAAGDYGSQSMIFDYVISSYTPNLSALLPGPRVSSKFSGLLAVGQASTPGMASLPGTVVELDRIQEKFQGLYATRLDGVEATPANVLANMEKTNWVHFACHANQGFSDPTKSAFYLHDGALDLATITQKQLKNAELAFLSACQTATGDKALSEEAVHLAAGMLAAGFRTVIATMWSIGDDDAPLIAEKVYEHLLEGGNPDARRAAVAVHQATACLRAKVGVREIAKWAPYIHIGL